MLLLLGRGGLLLNTSSSVGPSHVVKEEGQEEHFMPVDLQPASEFTIPELTDIYNQTRMDYIVPMPMNPARLQEYINTYDVVLEYSSVAVLEGQILGLSMLGVRPGHTWVTRLGVLPVQRRKGAGVALMQDHVDRSRDLGVDYITLDVIRNNKPAHRLFHKLGFRDNRELLILRRPPGPPKIEVTPYSVTHLESEDAIALLYQRRSVPSWLDETPSLINSGNLYALKVEMQNGGRGWLVYQKTVFQLGRLVVQTEAGDCREVARTLAHALHAQNPVQDTKTENFPLHDPHLPGLQDMGYIESFRRIELRLPFK